MDVVETLYGPVDKSVFDNFAKIKLLVLDVDGVLSDGNIYMGNDGEELKSFNTKDGYGIKAMQSIGIQVGVITGRQSNLVSKRMASLNVKHVIQGRVDKATAIKEIFDKTGLQPESAVSIGDDMPDIGMFENSAVGVAVHDAHPYVKKVANYVTYTHGGRGAVREVCDLILDAKGLLAQTYGASI